jgi:hypothetical protein
MICFTVKMIPLFEKEGQGGFQTAPLLKNPPQSPFSKGGSIINNFPEVI